jgi:cysteine desulfurase
VVHTDAVQAAVWMDLAQATAGTDLVSVSAHKLGGPMGAGALAVRHGTRLEPLLHGGGQEQERRSGTHDVAGAVGLAVALELAAAARAEERARVGALRDLLADGLLAAVEGTTESADRSGVLPGHCHLRFAGVEQEELLVLLDDAGICASGGAACASGALRPSHVLAAMGVPAAEARGAVRFTLGYTTSSADVERALAAVPPAVARLRS